MSSLLSLDLRDYEVHLRDPDEVVTAHVLPYVLLKIERRWPGRKTDFTDSMPNFEGMLYGFYVALGEPGGEEEFYMRVVNFRVLEAQPSLDPTQAGAMDD